MPKDIFNKPQQKPQTLKYILLFVLGFMFATAAFGGAGYVISAVDNYFSVDTNGNTNIGQKLHFGEDTNGCNSTYNLSIYFDGNDLVFCKDNTEYSLVSTVNLTIANDLNMSGNKILEVNGIEFE